MPLNSGISFLNICFNGTAVLLSARFLPMSSALSLSRAQSSSAKA